MTIQTTAWDPDTCGCEIRYQWDDTVPQNERVTTVSTITRSCPYHNELLPNQLIVYTTVLDESKKKNDSLQVALDTVPSVLADTIQNGNTTYNVLKPTIIYDWQFSGTAPNRTISISFGQAQMSVIDKQGKRKPPANSAATANDPLTQTQKDQIQQQLNGTFGVGIITIT